MQFLELANRARRKCGVAGADLVTLQSGLTKEGQRFKDWTASAWEEVQLMHTDWQWMRKTVTFNTTPGQPDYTPAQAGAANAGDWVKESFRVYLASAGVGGEQFMNYRDYSRFRDLYEFSSMRLTQSMPLDITVKPDHSLGMWPLPADVYTITGEFYREPSDLSADADDPASTANGLPDRFHMLIVGMVMQSYAAFESAPEVDARGAALVKRYKGRLESWGLQQPTMAGAL